MGTLEGFCQCGCGQKTTIARQTRNERGDIKGEPVKYIKNHHMKGENNSHWKGGTAIDIKGRILIHVPSHPKARTNSYIHEYILLAEKTLGKYLPDQAVIHHHTEDQIVICQDQAYHLLLHKRERALKLCGYANWLRCRICKQYDDPKNLTIYLIGKDKKQTIAYHSKCKNEYDRQWLKKKALEKRQDLVRFVVDTMRGK